MALVVNQRDVLLQASVVRVEPVGVISYSDISDPKPPVNADNTETAVNAGIALTNAGAGFVLSNSGVIRGGQTTFNTGNGFFLGYNLGYYKFSFGNSAGHNIRWDGSTLTIAGNVNYAYVQGGPPVNADNTITEMNKNVNISSGIITMSSGGTIRSGQTGFDSGVGFYLGGSGSRFSIGDANGYKITWDGIDLKVVGNLAGGTIAIGWFNNRPGFWVMNTGVGLYTTLSGFTLTAENSYFSGAALTGISRVDYPAIYGYSSGDNWNSHAIRGTRQTAFSMTSGLVGSSIGYDFYAEGTGSSYGPFTGAHDALVDNATTVVPGDIVVDVAIKERRGWSNTIFEVIPSSMANQSRVIGVIATDPRDLSNLALSVFVDGYEEKQDTTLPEPPGAETARAYGASNAPSRVPHMTGSYYTLKENYKAVVVNALGEGQIRVCGEGGDLAPGDLIVTSSIAATGMKQSDNIIRSHTVAKARETVVFAGSPTDIRTVACIYLCG